jgi:membrane protease YdiL (CAAX protease family)
LKRLMFWALFALTLSVYATMLAWSLPTVSAAAGGLPPFDMRPAGYTFAEARAFLAALTPDGAAFYAAIQQRLDIAYPALIALTLFFAIAALAPKPAGRWRWALAATALPLAIFDYLENHAVAGMIEAGASGLTPAMVEVASQWTVLKSSATSVAMTLLLVLACVKLGAAMVRRWGGLVRRWVARHPVLAFIGLAYAISWPVQIVGAGLGLSMMALSSVSVILGLAIPAFAITAITDGRAGVADLAHRWLRWRVSPGWYLLAGFGLLAAMVVAVVPFQGAGPILALGGSGAATPVSFLVELALGFVFIQMFEELAWTGFLQHRLQGSHGFLRASLMIAPVFAISHLAVNYLGAGALVPALAMVGVQIVFALFFRVVMAWFYEGAGHSVLIAALFHAALNASNGDYVESLVGSASGWLPLLIVAVGGGAIGFARWHAKRQQPRGEVTQGPLAATP